MEMAHTELPSQLVAPCITHAVRIIVSMGLGIGNGIGNTIQNGCRTVTWRIDPSNRPTILHALSDAEDAERIGSSPEQLLAVDNGSAWILPPSFGRNTLQ